MCGSVCSRLNSRLHTGVGINVKSVTSEDITAFIPCLRVTQHALIVFQKTFTLRKPLNRIHYIFPSKKTFGIYYP